MAKNDKGTWVGKTMQPTFQTYPTAGMIHPASSSSTAPPSTPATNTPPPPSNVIPPLTPTLPIGNITIGEGGGYPIIGDIILPNSNQDFTNVTPERESLVTAVMNATYAPPPPPMPTLGGGSQRGSTSVRSSARISKK